MGYGGLHAAALSSSWPCHVGRSLWKVSTFVGPQLLPGLAPGLFLICYVHLVAQKTPSREWAVFMTAVGTYQQRR